MTDPIFMPADSELRPALDALKTVIARIIAAKDSIHSPVVHEFLKEWPEIWATLVRAAESEYFKQTRCPCGRNVKDASFGQTYVCLCGRKIVWSLDEHRIAQRLDEQDQRFKELLDAIAKIGIRTT